MWYFVHFILLPSGTRFALLAVRVCRGTVVGPITGGHFARAWLGVL
jgi:predicted secreted protein